MYKVFGAIMSNTEWGAKPCFETIGKKCVHWYPLCETEIVHLFWMSYLIGRIRVHANRTSDNEDKLFFDSHGFSNMFKFKI